MGSVVEARQAVDAEGVAESLGWGPSLQSVSLVGACEVVAGEEAVEIGLDLNRILVPGGSSVDAEALIEQRTVHPLDKSVGSRRAHLGRAVLNVFESQQQLVRVLFRSTAKLASIIGEHGSDLDSEGLVEGQDPVVEEM